MSGPGYISVEKPQQCDLCGKIAELRPYGPRGECVCFQCGMMNIEAARRGFAKYVLAEEASDGRDAGPDQTD